MCYDYNYQNFGETVSQLVYVRTKPGRDDTSETPVLQSQDRFLPLSLSLRLPSWSHS